MGENGSGKSTLLKIILDEVAPDNGNFKLGANLVVGYLPQNVTFENEDLSILVNKINDEMALFNDNAEKLYQLFKEKEDLEEILLQAYETLEELQN